MTVQDLHRGDVGDQRAARLQHPRHLAHGRGLDGIRQHLQHVEGRHDVEARRGIRHRRRRRLRQHPSPRLPSRTQAAEGVVEPEGAAVALEQDDVVAGAAAAVEQPRRGESANRVLERGRDEPAETLEPEVARLGVGRGGQELVLIAGTRRVIVAAVIYTPSVRPPADPIVRFQDLFLRAADNAPFDPVAVTLATATPDGRPSARVILLRRVDEQGFGFFTNYASRKARELTENPYAAICAYWPWLDEQARIEGRVRRAEATESDAYFARAAARQPGRSVGVGPERRALVTGRPRGALSRCRCGVRGTGDPPAAFLGRLPVDPRPHRVLACRDVSPARPAGVRPRRRRVEDGDLVSVAGRVGRAGRAGLPRRSLGGGGSGGLAAP